MEEERKINRLLRDDPENDKLNDRLQQVTTMTRIDDHRDGGGDDDHQWAAL